jgi:hypothetical protein
MTIHCLHNHRHNSTIKNSMCTPTSQYGSWNIILKCLMPFLCMGSIFPLILFLGPYSHSYRSMAHLIVSNADTHIGGTLIYVSLLNVV